MMYVLSESFMHLPLRPIFRQSHPNFINVRTAYASKIWAQLTKNLLAKSSTKRFREYIKYAVVFSIFCFPIHPLFLRSVTYIKPLCIGRSSPSYMFSTTPRFSLLLLKNISRLNAFSAKSSRNPGRSLTSSSDAP